MRLHFTTLLILVLISLHRSTNFAAEEYDVVIYGGTAGGIAAGIQAKRMGKSVIVIEPTRCIGGLTTGGLGQTDIGNKAAIGGISREFYQRIRTYYQDPAHWKWQKPEQYRDGGQTRTGNQEETMWTFEPSAALQVLKQMVKDADLPVVYEQRLDREQGVKKEGTRIVSIRMESGEEYRGKMFIDATYEGDLLAAAGVDYIVGREANDQYNETLNGVQTHHAVSHQLKRGIDPYVEPGNPQSGLLPFIDPNGPGKEGSQDHRVQAYCFRMCLTDHPDNRIPFAKPEGYNELWYELLLRNFEAGETGHPWINSSMPNRKTDTNNRTGFSTDFIGQNYDYPEATYEERQKIIEQHRLYQQGLMWTLANHPRVPESIRKEFSRWGTCKDEFAREDGWQEQLYIREARRMVGAYVMTQHNCQGRATVEDSVGLAAYTMDSHNVQRYVDENGHVRNEGDVQVGGFSPYPISYQSLIPQAEQCSNLLVPVCLSASHIAFGSIRMEPVFMVLGQSAATAACLAIDEQVSVQELDASLLQARLLKDAQILEWTGPTRTSAQGIDPAKLQGIVVDDNQAELKGFGFRSSVIGPFIGTGYRHDNNENKGEQTASFSPEFPAAGMYEVRIAYTQHENRATNIPVTVRHAQGTTLIQVNQKQKPAIEHIWHSLGQFQFEKGKSGSVSFSNQGTNGHIIIDAVQFLPVKD